MRSNSGDKVSHFLHTQEILWITVFSTPRLGIGMRYVGIKGKVWEVVKRSVRRREKDCYTCHNTDLQGKNAQAGHYFPVGHQGSNNVLSWHPKLIHLQCSRCNGAGQGMQNEYRAHLIKDYGQEFVDEIHARRYRTDPVKNWQYIIELFENV